MHTNELQPPDDATLSADPAWDGAPGWPRPRTVHLPDRRVGRGPATFVQSDPTDATSAHAGRLQACFSGFRCQVCGAPVLEIDTVGWLVMPGANMGGACCTRCAYLALRACPHLVDAPSGTWTLVAVTEPTQYRWRMRDGRADGHVEAADRTGQPHTLDAFLDHHARWRRSRAG